MYSILDLAGCVSSRTADRFQAPELSACFTPFFEMFRTNAADCSDTDLAALERRPRRRPRASWLPRVPKIAAPLGRAAMASSTVCYLLSCREPLDANAECRDDSPMCCSRLAAATKRYFSAFSWRSAAWTPIALWPVLLRDASAAGNLLLAGRVAPKLWQATA
jgi:hypothetical protein